MSKSAAKRFRKLHTQAATLGYDLELCLIPSGLEDGQPIARSRIDSRLTEPGDDLELALANLSLALVNNPAFERARELILEREVLDNSVDELRSRAQGQIRRLNQIDDQVADLVGEGFDRNISWASEAVSGQTGAPTPEALAWLSGQLQAVDVETERRAQETGTR